MILAQAGTKHQNLDEIISFILRTSRYESHKELARNVENDLKRIERCAFANVLFQDDESKQLYTIVFSKDDDFRNTN